VLVLQNDNRFFPSVSLKIQREQGWKENREKYPNGEETIFGFLNGKKTPTSPVYQNCHTILKCLGEPSGFD
jgi:hypothetical protein